MAYGWGANEPIIDRPLDEGGDNIQINALKIKNALDLLFMSLNQDFDRASSTEITAGTNVSKIVSPAALKPVLDELRKLSAELDEAVSGIQRTISKGAVYNSERLDGQEKNYYRCANGCSWTCSSGCTGGCGNSCTGSCLAGCSGGCSSCTGSCTGSCMGSCTGSCLNTCTYNCRSNCSGSCSSRG